MTTPEERLSEIREKTRQLEKLLDQLYPDPVSPDILTMDDVLRRYPLTELGTPAQQAIEQAQRINRRVPHNYDNVGLCEFHVGLIRLYWRDCRAAAGQFREAAQQWSFINKTTAVSLAHLAAGVAHYLAHAHETAMTHFSRTEKMLSRLRQSPPPDLPGSFIDAVAALLDEAREQTRLVLWPPDEPTLVLDDGETAVYEEEAEAIAEETAEEPPEAAEAEEDVSPPITHLTGSPPPIPGHHKYNDRLVWYRVIDRRDEFLRDIKLNTWLLVDTSLEAHQAKEGDLIIFASDDVEGSIIVQPNQDRQVYKRIYLAALEPTPVGTFTRDKATGTVTFSAENRQIPAGQTNIVGFVIGYWLHFLDSGILEA